MSKELEALEEIKKYIEDNITTKHNHVEPEIKIVEEALQRLEEIDNANPSEALGKVAILASELGTSKDMKFAETRFPRMLSIIQQALIKAQENEKVLKTVFKKKIDLESFYMTFIENNYDYNYYEEMYGTYGKEKLIEEEFNFLKRYLCQNE